MLDEGKISAYFGDRSILLFLIKDSKAPEKLRLADDYRVEPTTRLYAELRIVFGADCLL